MATEVIVAEILEAARSQAKQQLNISMTSSDVEAACKLLGSQGGQIDTTVYYGPPPPPPLLPPLLTSAADDMMEVDAQPSSSSSDTLELDPPDPFLRPKAPSIFVSDREVAFSPQLQEFCYQRPIALVRNLANVCGLDQSLFSTKTLVQSHPKHKVEIRLQMEQSPDENWTPSMEEQTWRCTSTVSSSTIAGYARYQAASFLEASGGGNAAIDPNPPCDFAADANKRRTIKFGTNCDLSDEEKWAPQLNELKKLPAWARVQSASNMLSHIGCPVLGMNTVQLYMKVPCCRTPGHQENNNFCAININVGPGNSLWFGVAADHWPAVEELCRAKGIDYMNDPWWPNEKDLEAAGIPFFRFTQRPGDLVWVNVGCVHWVQAAGWCNNIAWNVGPLSHRQYVMAMERYEWNKGRAFKSVVAMILLSWNLARNLLIGSERLHAAIKTTLLHSLRATLQMLDFVGEKGVPLHFNGRETGDHAHFCLACDEEVFNLLFVVKKGKRVRCLRCAIKRDPGLTKTMCLQEYELDDLFNVYNNFVCVRQAA